MATAEGAVSSQFEGDAAKVAQALADAKRTGEPVEIPSRRTETDEVFINPDGTARVDRALLPVRVRQGSKLVDIDPNLAAGADGRLAPNASAMAVSFSGGGDDVFATMISEGRTVTLTWPHGKLPEPTVNGRTATYANVLPGVDLTATADDVSFSHALVVKTPDAAKNPAVRSIEFGLRAQGLQVTQEDTGEILAKTPSQNALFTAPQPHMWDSAGSQEAAPRAAAASEEDRPAAAQLLQDTLEGAVEGSNQAPLGVKLGDGKLTLTPDATLLDDPETVYPVVIDPDWTKPAFKNAWSIAYKHSAYPGTENTVYYNSGTLSDEARVGVAVDGSNGGTVRANTYFRIPIANLAGKDIIDSELRIKQTHAGSWSCKSGDVQVRTISEKLPGDITWNNQPSWGALVDSSGESYGGRNCPSDSAGLVEFNVTSAIKDAVDDGWGSWSFVLTSKSNAVDTSWRKFDPNSARVSTKYNTLPTRPTLTIDPSLPCAGGTIGLTDEIVLNASKFTDAENDDLDVEFKWAQNGQTVKTATRNASSGGTAQLRIPAGAALQSATFWYEAVVKDGVGNSPRAGRCYFTYDRTAPPVPKISSIQFPENQGTGCKPDMPKGTCSEPARTTGTFTFEARPLTPSQVNDVAKYVWWTDYDTRERAAKPATVGGSVTVSFMPLSAGPQFLYARSEDAANNRSSTKAYLFIPTRSAERDKTGDLNGDAMIDLATVDPGAGTLWTYPGRGDGTFGQGIMAREESFAAATVTHGGNWDEKDGYTDVVALQPAVDDPESYELWVYRGDGNGRLLSDSDSTSKAALNVDNDSCNETDPLCKNHWRNGAEILSVPSFSDDTGMPDGEPDTKLTDADFPDLLVKEGSSLWLYLGYRSGGPLAAPIALGNADWQDMTVMTPGDLNKDGLPEIWARDKVKGTIHQYTSKRATTPGQGNILADLTVYADPAVRQTSIATGFKGADVPHLATSGDFENDGFADLWSRGGDGRTVEYPGQANANGSSAFGPARHVVIAGYDWGKCTAFPLAAGTGTAKICGPILGKYESLGGPAGFGKPTSDVTTLSDGGRYVNFAQPGTTATDRAISWSKTTGAWSVANSLFVKWNSMGRETGALGYPTGDARYTNVQGGDYNTFSKAGKPSAIYGKPGLGPFSIRGAVYRRYVQLGGVKEFGYPTGDETPIGPDHYQDFRHEVTSGSNISFYWDSVNVTGAWPVEGSIRNHWLSAGGHTSSFGFPKSPEYTVLGGRRSNFKNGYIRWNRESGHVAGHTWEARTMHLRTDLAGDYDGDGRTDILTPYDYEKATTGLYVAKANAEGGHNPPQEYWNSDQGEFDHTRTKWASGDFNGDGRDDVVGFYGYGTGAVAAWSFLTQTAGPAVQKKSVALDTGWTWSRTTLLTGDVNGDGRDDLIYVYNYGDGLTGVFRSLARTDGTFDDPVLSYKSPSGYWWSENVQYAIGDTNGDGRDDIVGFYGFASGAAALYTFTAKADGSVDAPKQSWNVPAGTWERDRVKLTTADLNKDGRDDLALTYGYDDGRADFRVFHSRTDGGFDTFTTPWSRPAGSWFTQNTGNLVSGDVDGDGRPDITTSYNYATGATRIFTFHGNEAGGVDSPMPSWYARPGTW
ncbi:FG-GAP-like repeat-containing protein [Streptomyces hydrogenans]